jgi:hypothetical protein
MIVLKWLSAISVCRLQCENLVIVYLQSNTYVFTYCQAQIFWDYWSNFGWVEELLQKYVAYFASTQAWFISHRTVRATKRCVLLGFFLKGTPKTYQIFIEERIVIYKNLRSLCSQRLSSTPHTPSPKAYSRGESPLCPSLAAVHSSNSSLIRSASWTGLQYAPRLTKTLAFRCFHKLHAVRSTSVSSCRSCV